MSASAPKKKINRADYMFAQLKDQNVVKKPGQVEGFQFAIRYLENCNASLYDYSAQVGTLNSLKCLGNDWLVQKFHYYDWTLLRFSVLPWLRRLYDLCSLPAIQMQRFEKVSLFALNKIAAQFTCMPQTTLWLRHHPNWDSHHLILATLTYENRLKKRS